MLTVLIDSTLSEAEQKKTLKHELAHIILNHFELDDRDIEEIEAEADAKAAIMTDAEMEALVKMASA
jgi:Zn-dependent peptidase ImmA (M78 family)